MATKWFKLLCALFLCFCFNFVFCFNRNNYVDSKSPTEKNATYHDGCPLPKRECCGYHKEFGKAFVIKHAREFRLCIAQSQQEGGENVSGFMKHNEGYEATPERKTNSVKGHECQIFECAVRELNLVDNKEQLIVAACETFLKQTFQSGELMDILLKENDKCVKLANKVSLARKEQHLSPNCNTAGIQYYLCLEYVVFAYCPEDHKLQTPTCAKHQEEMKKCYEGQLKV